MEDTTEKWLQEGTLLYTLEGTGHYRKGAEEMQNRIMVNLTHGPKPHCTATDEETTALAGRLLLFLNNETPKPTKEFFVAALGTLQEGMNAWLESTFPIGSPVRFKFSEKEDEFQTGCVKDYLYNRFGGKLLITVPGLHNDMKFARSPFYDSVEAVEELHDPHAMEEL